MGQICLKFANNRSNISTFKSNFSQRVFLRYWLIKFGNRSLLWEESADETSPSRFRTPKNQVLFKRERKEKRDHWRTSTKSSHTSIFRKSKIKRALKHQINDESQNL